MALATPPVKTHASYPALLHLQPCPLPTMSTLIEIDATIDKMKQCWPSNFGSIDHHPCDTTYHNLSFLSHPPPPASYSTDNLLDYQCTLVDIHAQIEQMNHCWPLPPCLIKNLAALPCATQPALLQLQPSSPQTPNMTLANKMVVPHTVNCHAMNPSSSILNSSVSFFDTSEGDITDPSLLAAVQILDNFLIQYL